MQNIKVYILFCFISIISACNDNAVSSGENGSIVPLKVGNYWKYKIVSADTVSGSYQESVDGEKFVNGEKWYTIVSMNELFFNGRIYYINRGDGLLASMDSGRTSSLYYKYPVKTGDFFGTTEIVETNQTIKTDVGSFSCVVYQKKSLRDSIWFYMNTYVSPGVGKIKLEGLTTKDHKSFVKGSEYILIEYKTR